MSEIELIPCPQPLHGAIRPPGSKSISNRVLLLAALAQGTTTLQGLLDSDDTQVMGQALANLGISCQIDWQRGQAVIMGGSGSFPNRHAELNVANSGTTIRFLTAALSFMEGTFTLQGTPRMHERPIGDLVEALTGLGADVHTHSPNQSPPVTIRRPIVRGGKVNIKGSLSSQYLSGLLMASPLAREPIEIEVVGELVSKPYVAMTLQNMASFGVRVDELSQGRRFLIRPQPYSSCDFNIEPDASAASYFMAAAAICGGTIQIEGLNRNSLQGDVAFASVLEQMGCRIVWRPSSIEIQGPALHGIDVDMSSISDTAQTLAAVSVFVQGPTRIRGVAHNRIKETDRIGNLAIELRRLGAQVIEHPDGMEIVPQELNGTTLATYDDHRMAMSLALIGLRVPRVRIQNPECVAKTYPNYFRDLAALREHVPSIRKV